MPTFSHIVLDRLLEPSSRSQKPPQSDQPIRRRQVSPALYATPEATQLPIDSPSSPVSPYIINHKIRGPRLLKDKNVENSQNGEVQLGELEEEKKDLEMEIEEEELELEINDDNLEKESEGEDFFEFNESMSNLSEENGVLDRSWKPGTPSGEFYDAFEEISSECGGTSTPFSSNKGNIIESELREMRLTLLMEIEKRKQAEESLSILQNQWLRLSQQLSLIGLNLSPQIEDLNVEDLCNQIRVSRVVNEAVLKGVVRAEVAGEMERVVEMKNFEIGRLMDRVQYYEAANREMTQRNQETIEMARQERNRRKRRQKWFYASIGLAVTLGSAAIVWSYLPASRSVPSDQKETTKN